MGRRSTVAAVAGAIALIAAGCSAGSAARENLTASTLLDDRAVEEAEPAPPEPPVVTTTTTTSATSTAVTPAGAAVDDQGATATGPARATPLEASTATPAPDWLGRRTLPTRPDGVVVPQTTPQELRQRRLVTVDHLEPPSDRGFQSSLGPLDEEVLGRSTWVPGCPIEAGELSYLTMSFFGFDGEVHTGEMIVHRDVAADILDVFEGLFLARFPIEEMRVVSPADLDAAPTGDGNNTTAFVCRPVTGGTTFSEHAFGLAVDINPFHNPYRRDELVLPELAGHYLDRSLQQPGMIAADDPVVEAFAAIGWSWGGAWQSLEDYQHFSSTGR